MAHDLLLLSMLSEVFIEFKVSDSQKSFLSAGFGEGGSQTHGRQRMARRHSSGPVKAAMIVTIQVCTMKQ